MRCVIEPERLKRLINAVLIGKKLDNTVGVFTTNGVQFNDISLEVIAVVAAYKKEYFLEYEAGENEVVPITSTLLDRLGWGFKGDKITFSTGPGSTGVESLILSSGDDEKYDEPMISSESEEFPIKMKMSDYGIVPEKYQPQALFLVSSSELDFPAAETYRLVVKDGGFYVNIRNVGNYTRKIKVNKTVNSEDLEVEFDGDYFQSIVKNLDGDVWLGLNPEAMVINKKAKDYLLTYLLSSIEEE